MILSPPCAVSLSVLLVDDNEVNQRLGSLMLDRLGCSVTCVGSGSAAIGHAAAQPYDLVLMDLRMPHMDGVETARRIRAAGARMPIVAVTASETDADRDACDDAGMDGLLVKPVSMKDLRRLLESLVGHG